MGGGRAAALVNHFWVHFFILLSIFSFSRSVDPNCVYTVYVRTGSIIKGGTDSKISLTLYNAKGNGIIIKNLEAWGVMDPDYNYFESGNLDIFTGKAPCLKSGRVCSMNLTSDGSGPHHGWYCNYVEVTTTGVHKPCDQQRFKVEQWLATDASPFKLTALRDYCPEKAVTGDFGSSPMISVI